MLLAAMFSIPLWISIPVYFALGLLWAFAYLPRSVAVQAKQYLKWKTEDLGGQSFPYWLLAKDSQYKREALITGIHHERFSERRIVRGFILNIAFWPLRIIQKFLLDLLPVVLENFWSWIEEYVFSVLARLLRWARRVLSNIFTHIERFLQWAWRIVCNFFTYIARFLRWVRNILRNFWNRFIVPAYQWVYKAFTDVYQLIIQRANREAIADLEALKSSPAEEKQ